MVSMDGSLFIQIVNFLFLIWVLNVVMYKPVRKVLLQRKEKMTGLEQDIETFGNEMREKQKAFSSGIREARAKGLKEKESLIQMADDEEKEIIGRINEKAQTEIVEVREQIAKDVDAVRNSLLNEIDGFAREIGQKILGRAV